MMQSKPPMVRNMIYVIGTGYYSDWNIVGYTTELEKAVAIAYEMNKRAEWSMDEAWVKPLDEIKADANKELYIRYFYRVANGEEFFENDFAIEKDRISEEKRDAMYDWDRNSERLWIDIRSNVERDKVLKICRDEIARQRAMREGV